MPSEKTIVFSLFNRFRLKLLVSRRHVSGRWLTFLACFRTFEDDGFSRHSCLKCQNYKSESIKISIFTIH